MSKPTIALAMIVRNEGHVLARCLRSVKPHIDAWCIVDTGSSDDTIAVAERELAGVPGRVERRPWGRPPRWRWGKRQVDFAHNRNEALDFAREYGTDYLLTIDADEELFAEPGAFDVLDKPAYSARFQLCEKGQAGGIWLRKLLLSNAYPWRYQGALHEYLELPGVMSHALPGLLVKSYHDSARNQDPPRVKYGRDAAVLKREIRRDPGNTRLWFYYAQSLAGAQQIDEAIEAYRRRAGMPGNEEEVFYSLLQIAALREFRGDHWHDVARCYLDAFQRRPFRAEPVLALAILHLEHGEPAIAELYARQACRSPRPPDVLMVREEAHGWLAADIFSETLAAQGKLADAEKVLRKLTEAPDLPPAHLPRVIENLNRIQAAA